MSGVLLLISFFPSWVQRPLRNLLGAQIQSGAKISWLSFVLTRNVKMGRNSRIGPLCLIKVKSLVMGEGASIHAMTLVNCSCGPQSKLEIGDFSQVFSFCVLEPSEGIFIGKHVGIGGQALIFCHGSWPNYLEGAPFAKGPVHIGDEVWLPWRVMILPNTTIGARAVIGAHSLVRGEVPANSLFSGVPAKFVSDKIWHAVNPETRLQRLNQIISDFHAFHEGKLTGKIHFIEMKSYQGDAVAPTIVYSFSPITSPEAKTLRQKGNPMVIDFANLRYSSGNKNGNKFVRFAAGYGLRLAPFN